jgi:peptidoglycan/LPS O-acetylase OafA/YrhL
MKSPTFNVTAHRLVFIDYLRIFAFASVLIGHRYIDGMTAVMNDPSSFIGLRWLMKAIVPLVRDGSAGVTVFFITSGYIIAHVLQTQTPREFLIKRVFRIYPLYVFAVVLTYFLWGRLITPVQLLQQVLLIGDFFGTPLALGIVEWTLRIEVTFYLLAAILAGLGFFYRRVQYLPLILIGIVLVLAWLPPFPIHVYDDANGLLSFNFGFLLLGTMIYLTEHGKTRPIWLIAYLLVLGVCYYRVFPRTMPALYPGNLALVGSLVFMTVWLLRRRLAATALVLFFSDLTYSVYLFHNWSMAPIADWLSAHLGLGSGRASVYLVECLTLLTLFAICYTMMRLIEKPGIGWGKIVTRR